MTAFISKFFNYSPSEISNRSLILLLAMMVAIAPFSIDLYLPGLPDIALNLSASEHLVQLTVSMFLLGLCLGMLIYGPLSDKFGRRIIFLNGAALYIIASIACVFALKVEYLIGARFIQALGAGACAVMARAMVRDVFKGNQIASVLSIMHIITMIAPLLAPILGGQILYFSHWRVLFILLLIFGVFNLYLTWRFLPETYPAEQRQNLSIFKSFKNYGCIILNKESRGLILCNGFSFASLFAFVTGSPFLYIHHYGISPQYYGFLFGMNIIGVIIATSLNTLVLKRFKIMQVTKISIFLIVAAAFLMLSGIFFSLMEIFMLAAFIMIGMTGMIGANCNARILQLNQAYAGSAMALSVATQFGLGALSSIIVAQTMSQQSSISINIIMAACALLAATSFYYALSNSLSKSSSKKVSEEYHAK
ncbi:drug efflux system [Gammaproteobacteria bacterium]|nr:drug efflux system [Gammaproteobacteria bacterium]